LICGVVERRKAALVEEFSEGARCQGGEGGGSVLKSFTAKDTKVHEGNHQGLIPVELFDELLAVEAKIITTGGTGETASVRSFIDGTRKRRGQECPRHTITS